MAIALYFSNIYYFLCPEVSTKVWIIIIFQVVRLKLIGLGSGFMYTYVNAIKNKISLDHFSLVN